MGIAVRRRAEVLVAMAGCALLASGCLHDRYHSDSARSATEQLLVSLSAERAVDELAIPSVAGRDVAFEVVGLGPGLEFYDDLDYVEAAFAERLMEAGARLTEPEDAELRMALRVAAIGSVSRQFTFGIPKLDIGLYRSSKQHGYTKLHLVTRDRGGELVDVAEPAMESSKYDYVEIMQIIFRSQDIYPDDRWIGID